MVEVLGILLAALIAGAAWSTWRLLCALRRLLPGPRPIRTAPLRLARRRLRHADSRAASQASEITRLKVALRMAERERDALRGAPAPRPLRDRFQEAKRAFALRFHPDRITAMAAERAIRIAMFKEHWSELRRIERE